MGSNDRQCWSCDMDGNLGLPARFWNKIVMEPNSGCWLWIATLSDGGYGKFWDGKRVGRAHRFSYRAIFGAIPHGLVLDHRCRTRCCVNPHHLEPITQGENCRRGDTGKHHSRKTHCSNGHPLSGGNLYVVRLSKTHLCRQCKICNRERSRLFYQRRRDNAGALGTTAV